MKKKFIFVTIFIFLILFSLVGTFYLNRISNEKGCTFEAKICPDGSYVGRVPPNCDFAPCPPVKPTPTTTVQGDCVRDGCSGELCLEASMAGKIMSPCIYRDEYSCFKYSKCEKQSDGGCGWTQTQQYASCLSKFQKQSITQPQ